MRQHLVSNIVFCLVAALISINALAQDRLDVRLKKDPDGTNGEMLWTDSLLVANGVSLPVRIEVTSKGNGAITIGGTSARVYDDHNDGDVFDNHILDIDIQDIDGDGFRDIILSGIVLNYEEKGCRITNRMAVVSILMYDKETGRYVRMFDTVEKRRATG